MANVKLSAMGESHFESGYFNLSEAFTYLQPYPAYSCDCLRDSAYERTASQTLSRLLTKSNHEKQVNDYYLKPLRF